MAKFKKWRGKEVIKEVDENVARALGKFALVAEGYAKKELQKGHGVITGTLRRSIHTAEPGYAWVGDDMKPAAGTPERGGQGVNATVKRNKITVQLGSGLRYAMAVHQGHHSFEGYHFLTIGVDKAKPSLNGILREYRLK